VPFLGLSHVTCTSAPPRDADARARVHEDCQAEQGGDAEGSYSCPSLHVGVDVRPQNERKAVGERPMSHHDGVWIPRWVRLWPGRTVAVAAPAGQPLPGPGPRQFTERHAQLLTELRDEADPQWSATALIACLEHLRTSTITEAGHVAVLDAWVDGPDAFCVVYQPPYETRSVGLRRTAADGAPTTDQQFRISQMTEAYDMGNDEVPDPIAFGWNVADFDIGEPETHGPSRYEDQSKVIWWGSLGDALPTRRTAT
jgi:hypothetical protein